MKIHDGVLQSIIKGNYKVMFFQVASEGYILHQYAVRMYKNSHRSFLPIQKFENYRVIVLVDTMPLPQARER